jgi:single-strand DNA-binding protein
MGFGLLLVYLQEVNMNTLNKVFLVGHIGSDPEINSSQKGKPYTRLSIATNRWRRDPEHEKGGKEDTTWHTVFVWGKQSELCAKYLKKGAPVVVEGYLSSYATEDKHGEKAWKSSVTAEKVSFLPNSNSSFLEPKFDS